MKKVKHPHSSQVLKVIQAFESVLPMAKSEGHLNMIVAQVTHGEHACGTIHCHGGWFAIACELHLQQYCGFVHGANKMAAILGFNHNSLLEQWAAENPKIWGNVRGTVMFCDEVAFISESRPEGAKTLQHIVDHWKEIYERLKALEQPSDPYQTSASKELANRGMEERIETDQPVKEIQNN